jgi:hypothetical protein
MHFGDDYYYSESRLKPSEKFYFSGNAKTPIFSKSLREASTQHYDVFLSHSARDKATVLAILEVIQDKGYSAYVDWIDDSQTDRNAVASKIKTAINKSERLLYIHTHNSINSKWTPWEIGCFDSAKGVKKIAIMPLLNDNNIIPSYSGQEYLEQYNTISANYLFNFIKGYVDLIYAAKLV